MSLIVVPVENQKDLKEFLLFPWRVYAGNSAWVPPLRSEMYRTLNPKTNPYLRTGPFRLWLAKEDEVTVGRILAGIDRKTNAAKGISEGYLSLFEVIPRYEAAEVLFETADNFLREMGMTSIRGPVSPSNGDDYRGLLMNDFDRPWVLMNSYNPPYYRSTLNDPVSPKTTSCMLTILKRGFHAALRWWSTLSKDTAIPLSRLT